MPARTVVHVIHDLRFGGTERRMLDLVAHLDRDRYRPLLACIDGLGDLAEAARRVGVEPVVLGRSRRWDVAGIARLARLVRRERADVVHGWLFLANAYARVGGRLGGAPAVVAAEGGGMLSSSPRRRRAIRGVERLLAPLTSAYVANSAATADELRRLGAPGVRIEIVHNGIAVPPPLDAPTRERLRSELAGSATSPLAVMVARLDAEFKDHTTFVRAVREVSGLHAAVVGDGPGREAAETEARSLGIADRMVFTGFRPDAPQLAAAADVSVLLTYSEGLSNVVLESMAAGVPVVATDIPGNREAVRDGVDGVLVPVGDVGATAAALARLVADEGERRRLGEAARRSVLERFSSAEQAERTMALYDRLLGAKPG